MDGLWPDPALGFQKMSLSHGLQCVHQVQSGASIHPDVFPAYNQSGASIHPDVFPAHQSPAHTQAHLV